MLFLLILTSYLQLGLLILLDDSTPAVGHSFNTF